jgi:hypothetical protein
LNRIDLHTADRDPVAPVFKGVLDCRERATLGELLVFSFE